MTSPPLHPIEEETLRRVRANLVRAMREQDAKLPKHVRHARRRLTVFGVGVVGAVAAAVIAFVIADPTAHDDSVDTVQGQIEMGTTVAPPTTVERPERHPIATTTTPAPPPPPAPTDFVAVTTDGRLVVVDVATGDELRELARRPGTVGGQTSGENTLSAITEVTVDRAKGLVYYETCCEPAVGTIWSVPLAGGESTRVADMGSPAVDAVGGSVLGLAADTVKIHDITKHTERRTRDPFVSIFHSSISPDGALIAYERAPGLAVDDARSNLVVVPSTDLDATSLDPIPAAGAREWVDPEGIGWMHPAINRDGNVVVAQQCCAVAPFGGDALAREGQTAARVVDPITGEIVGSFSYPAPVADQEYDASGSWLLVTLTDGRILWLGGGGRNELIASGYVAADW